MNLLWKIIPIALFANTFRITFTGILYNMNVADEIVNKVFHDWAGYIMMPVALGVLFLELQILARLIIDAPKAQMRPQ